MYVDIVCELSFMLGFVSKHVYIILTLRVDQNTSNLQYTMEPLLRGHPNDMPLPLVRSIDNVNLNIDVLISTPYERPPLLKGHFSDAKGVASQEGFHCTINYTL